MEDELTMLKKWLASQQTKIAGEREAVEKKMDDMSINTNFTNDDMERLNKLYGDRAYHIAEQNTLHRIQLLLKVKQ